MAEDLLVTGERKNIEAYNVGYNLAVGPPAYTFAEMACFKTGVRWVQGFSAKPTSDTVSAGMYGVKGDVQSDVSYKNTTGTIDILAAQNLAFECVLANITCTLTTTFVTGTPIVATGVDPALGIGKPITIIEHTTDKYGTHACSNIVVGALMEGGGIAGELKGFPTIGYAFNAPLQFSSGFQTKILTMRDYSTADETSHDFTLGAAVALPMPIHNFPVNSFAIVTVNGEWVYADLTTSRTEPPLAPNKITVTYPLKKDDIIQVYYTVSTVA